MAVTFKTTKEKMAMKKHFFWYINELPSLQFIYKNTGNPELKHSVSGLLE